MKTLCVRFKIIGATNRDYSLVISGPLQQNKSPFLFLVSKLVESLSIEFCNRIIYVVFAWKIAKHTNRVFV